MGAAAAFVPTTGDLGCADVSLFVAIYNDPMDHSSAW